MEFNIALPENAVYVPFVHLFCTGDDPHLNTDNYLPILKNDLDTGVQVAVTWAYNRWCSKPESILQMYCAGAAVTVLSGLCRKRTVKSSDSNILICDGKCKVISNTEGITRLGTSDAERVSKWLTPENLSDALSIIVATKVSWWLCNHHTGGDKVQNYLKKVLKKKFGEVTKDHIEMASIIGQWASTAYVLSKGGVQGIVDVDLPFHKNTVDIVLTKQECTRFKFLPPGTSLLILAYESARRLIASPFVTYCPGVKQFLEIAILLNKIFENAAAFHPGSFYLIEKSAIYDDAYFESFLGRLGSYIRIMCPESVLACSPYLTESKVQSYVDYNTEWVLFLKKVKESGVKDVEEEEYIDCKTLEEMRRLFEGVEIRNAVNDDDEEMN